MSALGNNHPVGIQKKEERNKYEKDRRINTPICSNWVAVWPTCRVLELMLHSGSGNSNNRQQQMKQAGKELGSFSRLLSYSGNVCEAIGALADNIKSGSVRLFNSLTTRKYTIKLLKQKANNRNRFTEPRQSAGSFRPTPVKRGEPPCTPSFASWRNACSHAGTVVSATRQAE